MVRCECARRSNLIYCEHSARVAKPVDAGDLKSPGGKPLAGSSPAPSMEASSQEKSCGRSCFLEGGLRGILIRSGARISKNYAFGVSLDQAHKSASLAFSSEIRLAWQAPRSAHHRLAVAHGGGGHSYCFVYCNHLTLYKSVDGVTTMQKITSLSYGSTDKPKRRRISTPPFFKDSKVRGAFGGTVASAGPGAEGELSCP